MEKSLEKSKSRPLLTQPQGEGLVISSKKDLIEESRNYFENRLIAQLVISNKNTLPGEEDLSIKTGD